VDALAGEALDDRAKLGHQFHKGSRLRLKQENATAMELRFQD
jgi:hypothetical protein